MVEIKMPSYVKSCADISRMLRSFLVHGIDVNELASLDRLIESSEIDQVKILNSYLPLVEQRALFGATRNINNITKIMKEKIGIARETHENPRTLELSLELMQHLSNLAPYIDEFRLHKKIEDNQINELSRILYRKANNLGFYQSVGAQLEEARITEEEVKTFVEKLNENIELEMETRDESA